MICVGIEVFYRYTREVSNNTIRKRKLQNGEFLPTNFGRAVVEAVVEAAVVVFCSEALILSL